MAKRRGQKTRMLTRTVTGIKNHTRKSGGVFDSRGIASSSDTGIKNHTHKSGGVFNSRGVVPSSDAGIKKHTRVTKRRG